MTNSSRKFIVADDHPLFRAALQQALKGLFDDVQIFEADDMESLQFCVDDHPDCDLVLLDLHMPGVHGFSGLIFINGNFPEIPVMIVSANETPEVMRRAVDYGSAGFLPKSSSMRKISEAIQQVLAGEIWLPEAINDRGTPLDDRARSAAEAIATLTPQQFRVATMLAEGLVNKEIAYAMDITEATVKAHLTAIYRKLGVDSRTQAVLAISSLDVQIPDRIDLARSLGQ